VVVHVLCPIGAIGTIGTIIYTLIKCTPHVDKDYLDAY
jgi:hypothetical protein